VDLERFTPEPLPPPPPGALFLGAIVPVKRPDLAIEVAEIAGIPLVIAGAPLDPASERLAAGLRERAGPLVEFAGAVDDPRPLLRDASALLHCADREAYGMALVEALACGRPVVAPDAGGPAEIVDQSCGRLYPPGDAHAAAAALAEAVADPELGAGARRRAESEFGLDRSRREWSAVVGGLARRAGGRAGEGLALVTVLHDSEPDVRRLVASVERHLPRAHLVAVDSGSSDGGAALVRGSSLRTTVIELDNVGYGRGSNRGLEAVEEPVTVILNPDVELLDDSLAALAAEVARDGGPERILAPVVVLPGGTRQDSVHPLPLSAPEAVTALVPPAALPPPLRLHAQPWRADHPRRAGWAVGCCIAGRTGTLRRLGPFDESVFMYGEDMELGMRAARDGVETWFWPAARVLHHQAQSSGRAFGGEPYEMLARRRREVIRDERGALAQRADDALQLVSIGGRLAAKTLLRRPAERERERLRALRRARRETEPG
jgi:GT2 family glycosyltransferase